MATETGFHCPTCDYTQTWAHGFMARHIEQPPVPGTVDFFTFINHKHIDEIGSDEQAYISLVKVQELLERLKVKKDYTIPTTYGIPLHIHDSESQMVHIGLGISEERSDELSSLLTKFVKEQVDSITHPRIITTLEYIASIVNSNEEFAWCCMLHGMFLVKTGMVK